MARHNEVSKNSLGAAPKFGLFVSTALASVALAGCAASAPAGEVSFAKAQAALEDGKADRAVTHAEAAVLAEPRNAGYRAVLGAAYLEEGRFQSAATAFGDALELGDSDPRTVLSYALAKVATGDNNSAIAKLTEYQGVIPSADLGLALALAGQPERGVHHLINTVRNGDNTAKARQNLAYAYALAGNWRAARVMAAEDVPADQLDARLSDWAAAARPEDYQFRVASLLGVSAAEDNGQPQHLALANFPESQVLVAEAAAGADEAPVTQVAQASVESPAPVAVSQVEAVEPAPARAPARTASRGNFATITDAAGRRVNVDTSARRTSNPRVTVAPQRVAQNNAPAAAPTPVAPRPAPSQAAAPAPSTLPAVAAAPSRGAPRFVSNAVVQDVPAPAAAESRRSAAPRAAAPQRRSAAATGTADTHLVQLGAFSTRAVAESKWAEMKRRFPSLAGHDVVITEARVNGRTFFRVAAAGFGRRSAAQMCNAVKSRGDGCFAYAAANPPAGAVDRGVRIAARTR